MEEKDNNDKTDDHGLFEQIPLQCRDGITDETGAIITRHDFDSRWERGSDVPQLALHSFNDVQCVLSLAHHDNAADRLAFPVPLRSPFADIRPKIHKPEIPDKHRCSVLASHGDSGQIVQGTQIAEASDHVSSAAQIENTSAHFVRTRLDTVDHSRKWDVVGQQVLRSGLDLMLADEP